MGYMFATLGLLNEKLSPIVKKYKREIGQKSINLDLDSIQSRSEIGQSTGLFFGINWYWSAFFKRNGITSVNHMQKNPGGKR